LYELGMVLILNSKVFLNYNIVIVKGLHLKLMGKYK